MEGEFASVGCIEFGLPVCEILGFFGGGDLLADLDGFAVLEDVKAVADLCVRVGGERV